MIELNLAGMGSLSKGDELTLVDIAFNARYCVSTDRMTSSPVGWVSMSGNRLACVPMSSSQASQSGRKGLIETSGGVGTLSSLSMSSVNGMGSVGFA